VLEGVSGRPVTDQWNEPSTKQKREVGMMKRTNRDSRPVLFLRVRTVLLFSAAFCVASALPSLSVHSSASQAASANAQSAPKVADPAVDQTPSAPLPSFEVASIKKHPPDNGPGIRVMLGGPDVSQFQASNVTAKMLIATAYDMKEFQISGGPGWINSERWDIDAKLEDSLAEQLRKLPREQQQAETALMLRSLLIDRFALEVKRETKEGNVLALVVAKGGPKLKEVAPPDPTAAPGPPPTPAAPGELPTPAPGQSFMMMRSGLATLSANAQPISRLVSMLSMQTGQQVVDQTGLKGTYQYTLQFTPQMGMGGMPLPAEEQGSSNSDTASIFTALEEQLGLKLESTKGPVETITIDHIEEPAAN
jgi:uncharacterized protein (TIGR03435 family)